MNTDQAIDLFQDIIDHCRADAIELAEDRLEAMQRHDGGVAEMKPYVRGFEMHIQKVLKRTRNLRQELGDVLE